MTFQVSQMLCDGEFIAFPEGPFKEKWFSFLEAPDPDRLAISISVKNEEDISLLVNEDFKKEVVEFFEQLITEYNETFSDN